MPRSRNQASLTASAPQTAARDLDVDDTILIRLLDRHGLPAWWDAVVVKKRQRDGQPEVQYKWAGRKTARQNAWISTADASIRLPTGGRYLSNWDGQTRSTMSLPARSGCSCLPKRWNKHVQYAWRFDPCHLGVQSCEHEPRVEHAESDDEYLTDDGCLCDE